MRIDTKEFKEYLLVYGADLSLWPEEIRERTQAELERSTELQTIFEESMQFEKVLQNRKYEEPDPGLSHRIITASLRQEQITRQGSRTFLFNLFQEFALPKPALTAVSVLIVSVLMIGFAIGYTNPLEDVTNTEEQTNLQEFLYYEGEIL
jgi:hypothetical protein